MKYTPLSKDFYTENRKAFMKKMNKNSVAEFNSNDIYPISADSTFPFEQHRDIFYLSGIDQEETILLLYPDSKDINFREIIFIRETNPKIQIWEGPKFSKKETVKLSGIKSVHWLENFDKIFSIICSKIDNIYWNKNEHYRANSPTQTREDRFIAKYKSMYPSIKARRSNPILQELRSVKSNEEINQIQNACNITEKGFRRILKFIKPNVWEYEIEAEFIHEFIKNKSKGFAYSPIIASGKNSNILHYNQNNARCLRNDLILIDVGAEYGNYSSDMTRTLPISGRFNKRQRAVYESVLNIKKIATKLLKPGITFDEFHLQVGETVTKELIKLNLLSLKDVKKQSKDNPLYKKFFMHGVSHHLGLDTHDYGLIENPLKANMVVTVEPGIYIPNENFGVRLEDVVLIQEKSEPLNLMNSIPIEVDEIENIMNS
jgi:Xaa-Pro aminopeptidase